MLLYISKDDSGVTESCNQTVTPVDLESSDVLVRENHRSVKGFHYAIPWILNALMYE